MTRSRFSSTCFSASSRMVDSRASFMISISDFLAWGQVGDGVWVWVVGGVERGRKEGPREGEREREKEREGS